MNDRKFSNTALITGASSGIGKAFARYHASQQGDLVLVARHQERLEAVKKEITDEFQVKVLTVSADLIEADTPKRIAEVCQNENITVDMLINNAGMGGHGNFHEREWQKEEDMIRLNILALTKLTHLFLPDFVKRNEGKILNVASVSSFLPGPKQAVYYATKSFVLSFSEALAQEVSKTGVSVTALCPGPTVTEFARSNELSKALAFRVFKYSPDHVAQKGYKAMLKGKRVVMPGLMMKMTFLFFLRLLPRQVAVQFSALLMKK